MNHDFELRRAFLHGLFSSDSMSSARQREILGPGRCRLRAPGYTDEEWEKLLGEEPFEEDA
jgi:hypothetical protein